MPKATPLINSFNAGEISPKVDLRSDVEKYYSGCRTLKNIVPLVEGGAVRMPGTYYVTSTKSSGIAVLIPFSFSTVQAYILEFGATYIRFYKDEGQILSGMAAYEITSPYAEADLFELKFFQSADIMWICHPSYPTKMLTRTGHTAWTLTDHLAKVGDEMEITDISQAATAVVTCTTVPATLEAGDIVYIAEVVGMTEVNNLFFTVGTVVTGAGGTFELSGINSTAYTAYDSAGTAQECIYGTEDNCPACGTFFEQRLVLGGSNNAPQRFDASVSTDYEDFNLGDEDDDAIQFTLASSRVDRILSMSAHDRYLFLNTVGGVFRAGASTAGDPATATNISVNKIISIGTKNLQQELVTDSLVWVSRGGRTLRKLSYSLEEDRPIAIDMTRIAKHIAMGATLATSGIKQMAFQREPLPILWAIRKDGQLLGMTYETQENVFAWFRIVPAGTSAKFLSVAVIGDDDEEEQVWVLVERTIDGATVRYIEYFKPFEFFSEIKDCFFLHSGLTWDGGDALTITGITKSNPAIVTCANGFVGGELVRIKSVSGMTQANTGLTRAWTVANPTAATFELSGITSVGWDTYESGGTVEEVKKTIDGLDHLEGESVSILIDGAVHPNQTVASGEITLSYYGNLIHVGLHESAVLEPMKLNAGQVQGTARGKRQRINRATVAFYETTGAKWGPDTDNLKIIPFGTGTQPQLFTGDKTYPFHGDWDHEATMAIVQEQPLPMTILGIIPEVTVNEP